MNSQEILVSVQLGAENIRVGTLWCHVRKGPESASFQYDDTWLNHPEKFALEPALQLTQGTFHTHNTLALFGAIGDSAPDRWERMLMRRHHVSHSTLFESDYLLGVNDLTRQGALRFSLLEATETYLASATQEL